MSGYKPYFHSINNRASGVVIYVRNDIPQSEIPLASPLQAVAVRVTVGRKTYILTSIYIPPSTTPTIAEFNSIISKFRTRYLINGDLNAHSVLLGSQFTCERGRVAEELLNRHSLVPLNTTAKTHWNRAHNTYSLVDHTLAHPAIAMDFRIKVLPDLHTSDHYPILLELGDSDAEKKVPHFNYKKADWQSLRSECRNTITPEHLSDPSYEGQDIMEVITTKLIQIANNNIPKTSNVKAKPSKPWIDEECKVLIRERKKAQRFNERHPSVPNSIRSKFLQAQSRKIFRRKKRQTWRNYVSSITSKTKCKKVWAMVKKLTGKNIPKHMHHLKDAQGNLITNPEDIAKKLAETFRDKSSSNNYSDDFKNIKDREEETPIDFSTNRSFKYNKHFKLRDLKRSIRKSKDSAAGPDEISNQILKNLPDETLKIILDTFNNSYWATHQFPPGWRHANTIPVPKENKNHQDPTNYRPIALTSCLCKTFERMINERLIHYLEKNKIISKFQCGFRNDKGTLDQLIRLDTYIRDAFLNGEHVTAVFFDLHKAYDTTWKHGILKDLYNIGLRGNLPFFIQNFMADRSFQVIFGSLLSAQYEQEEGVPQGSILSTTLFNIKLNGIVKEILPGVQCSLYVDDFVIYFRSKSTRTVQRKLQRCISKVTAWATANGFTVAEDKTVAMHFCRKQCCQDPKLYLDEAHQIPIKFNKEVKFLGLMWDPKLTFRAHITYLKKKCQSPLNLLKVLSHTDWGADTKTLLKIYRSLVRSKLDYGCIVYRNATKSDLQALDVIHNQGLRLSLGAFKSSPVESLCVEANEPPLEQRRMELAMKYGLKIIANPQNPAYNTITNIDQEEKYNNQNRPNSLAIDLKSFFEAAEIDTTCIRTNFIPNSPPCYSKPIDVCLDLTVYPKAETPAHVYIAKFNEIKSTKYPDYTHFYTDGSKTDEITSYGVFSNLGTSSSRIRNLSSIFTAEAEGIKRALRFILISPNINRKYVIFSDSKSVLESLQNFSTKNTVIKETIDLIQRILISRKTVKFCWVPGHVGIVGNENADQAAKRAQRREEPPHYRLPHTDLYPKVSTFVKQNWQNRWELADRARPNKLFSIQNEIKPFDTHGLTRKEETVIHRLRIGHTRLTHAFLMRGGPRIPDVCCYCNNPQEILSVKHIMIHCPALQAERARHYDVPTMKDLFETVSLRTILAFLQRTGIYKEI